MTESHLSTHHILSGYSCGCGISEIDAAHISSAQTRISQGFTSHLNCQLANTDAGPPTEARHSRTDNDHSTHHRLRFLSISLVP
jgi:hypothetical protein